MAKSTQNVEASNGDKINIETGDKISEMIEV